MPELTGELWTLNEQYGPARWWTVPLATRDFEPVTLTDRVGEVCMVIRRPTGRLLTARKTTYPPTAHRLLTGGIQLGEPVLTALWREVAEETNLTCRLRRLLAVVIYTHAAEPVFTTAAWLLDEIGGTLACVDPTEQHAAFTEMSVAELPARAAVLAQLDPTAGAAGLHDWAAWGHFRAVIHRAVHAALVTLPPAIATA